MAFGDYKPETPKLTAKQVLEQLDTWNAEKLRHFKLLLVRNFCLNPSAEVTIFGSGGNRIHQVTISELGITATYEISSQGIPKLVTKHSLNQEADDYTNVSAHEEDIINTQQIILTEYFAAHPEDCPE
jgi:hypothetical protein